LVQLSEYADHKEKFIYNRNQTQNNAFHIQLNTYK